jgi:hypothetical protein
LLLNNGEIQRQGLSLGDNMKNRQTFTVILWLLVCSLLISGCAGNTATNEVDLAVAVALTQTAMAVESEAAVATGTLSGVVSLQAPPTPVMVVYAFDSATGLWFSVETSPTEAAVPFSLEVAPGSYQIFAFAVDSGAAVGYPSDDGWSLGMVTVAAGQTISDIRVSTPSQSACGSTFGVPDSPDGRFAGYGGATEECRAAMETAMDPNAELQSLGSDPCLDLETAMEVALGLEVSNQTVPVVRAYTEQTGNACQMTALANGTNFENIFLPFELVTDVLYQRFWLEYMEMPMCLGYGGLGPVANVGCYYLGNQICELFVYAEPRDSALCEGYGPIGECLSNIAPEDVLHNIQLTCAQGFDTGQVQEGELISKQIRIQFAPGATNTTLQDTLVPGELHDYVLTALAGQEMTVRLTTPNPVSAIMHIGGLDGTRMATDFPAGGDWVGVLPFSQDYYIDVVSTFGAPVDYTLYVYISPSTDNIVPGFGNITGGISYGGDTIPPLHIVAYNQGDGTWHWLGTAEGTTAYTMTGIPTGTYQVVAYTKSDLIGGYGSGGVLNTVVVRADETTINVDLTQWYQPGSVSFPAEPIGW